MHKLTLGLRPYVLLTLLCLITLLPGLSGGLPVMDRDEARFVQATRQMVESGDYIVVRFQNELRAKKPVGLYWLQAASLSLFGDASDTNPLPYRLPSAVAMWGAVLLTFRIASGFFDRRIALLAAGLLATSVLAVIEGHLAKTDATLLLLTTAAQGFLGLLYLQARGGPKAPTGAALFFWIATGLGILVKGPVTPVISLLTILALWVADRRIAWTLTLRPILGLILVTAIVAPWVIAVSQQTGGAFLGKAVSEDLLPKLLGGQESHGALPGFYLALVAVTFWPTSLFVIPAVIRAWHQRTTPAMRFLLAWAGPAWLMFELTPTKLPHYILPDYPALAIMVAALLVAIYDKAAERMTAWGYWLWYGLWGVVSLVLAGVFIALPFLYGQGFAWISLPAAMLVLGITGYAFASLMKEHFLRAALVSAGGAAILYVTLFLGLIPRLDALWVSDHLAETLRVVAPGAPVALAGYSEPSAVFLLGTETRLVDGATAADFLKEAPGRAVAIDVKAQEAFTTRAAAIGVAPIEKGLVEGFNYSRGKPVSLHVFVNQGG